MKTLLHFFLLMCGVFYAETDKVKPVMEGDSVTLNPNLTQIQGFIEILWRFGDKGSTIAQIDGNKTSYEDYEVFRDRLQLDHQTGSLTITNVRINHSGLYKAEINHKTGTSDQKFRVAVYEPPSVIAGSEAEMKSVSVKEGDPAILQTDVPQLTGDELIVWRFGDEGKLIAKHDIEAKSSPLYDSDERFRDGLKLDHQTGSLIITKTRTTDSGLYTAKISSNKQTLYKRFIVTVTVPDSGLSPGAVAGIVVGALLVAVAVGVMYYRRPRTSILPNQMLTVTEGYSVTLNPDTKIQTADEIQWLFGAEDTLIAEIKKTRKIITHEGPDMIFMDRLKLDKTIGSLSITGITAAHTGIYTLKIRRGREKIYKIFFVSLSERMKLVLEGESVTLKPDTEINKHDVILWLFGDERQVTPLIEFNGETEEIFTYDDVADGSSRDRLELDKTTGSLTIKNTRTAHSGYYHIHIRSSSGFSYQTIIVTVKDKVEEKLLNKGDSVNLNHDPEIQRDDQILWMFGDQDNLIAQIKGGTGETYDGDDGRFKDRLKLDRKTGSLTITNIEAEHTGLYKLQTISSSGGILYKKFRVLIQLRYVNGRKGEPVCLHTGFTEIQTGDLIQWMFGDENSLIAEIKGGTEETYDGPDGRFRDRLELNNQTGDLIINNSTAEHAGDYKLKIRSSEGNTNRTFIVNIRWYCHNEVRKKSMMKEKNDCTENQVNESATVEMPLLNGEDVDVVNEEEGTSSL